VTKAVVHGVCRNNVGISGSKGSMFYVAVTDQMKVGTGGGLVDEGELIDVVEMPVKDAFDIINDNTVARSTGLMLASLSVCC
jgi:UDP-sugar diphosphatase